MLVSVLLLGALLAVHFWWWRMSGPNWMPPEDPEAWREDATGKPNDEPVSYQKCPACHHRTAFINSRDGLLTCALCHQVFHRDFERFVQRIREVPDPPR